MPGKAGGGVGGLDRWAWVAAAAVAVALPTAGRGGAEGKEEGVRPRTGKGARAGGAGRTPCQAEAVLHAVSRGRVTCVVCAGGGRNGRGGVVAERSMGRSWRQRVDLAPVLVTPCSLTVTLSRDIHGTAQVAARPRICIAAPHV